MLHTFLEQILQIFNQPRLTMPTHLHLAGLMMRHPHRQMWLREHDYYITPIRDMGGVITASIGAEISGTQVTKSTFRDFQEDIYSGAATEAQTGTPQDDELRDTNFGGIGTVLGFSNTAFPDGSSFSVSFNEQNQTLVDNETSQNVYAIINPGQYTGNVKTISGITKASPAVITTSQDHGLTVTTAISAITKANPAVVTAASHGFSNGDQVLILNVGGMTQLKWNYQKQLLIKLMILFNYLAQTVQVLEPTPQGEQLQELVRPLE